MHIAEVRKTRPGSSFRFELLIDGAWITGSNINGYINTIVKIFNDVTQGKCLDTSVLLRRLADKQKRGDLSPEGLEVIQYVRDVEAGKNMHGHLFSWQQGGSTHLPYYIPDVPEECGTDENYALAGDDVDTFGIGAPKRKSTKPWTPDTVDPSVDVMDIIHQVCGRPMR